MRYFFVFISILMFVSCGKNEIQNPVKRVTGTVETIRDFPSDFVSARNIEIWLPPAYRSDYDGYPVIYMHDGQNVFNPETSYNGNDWMVDEVMTRLIENDEVPPAIIVAVWNSGNTRFSEYMPQKPDSVMNSAAVQERVRGDTGSPIISDQYLQFLTSELKPHIDSVYATKADPDHTYIMGSSMGGLISLYALAQYPEIFGGAACLSTHWVVPELGDAFMSYLPEGLPEPGNHRIYFDHGSEGLDSQYGPAQKKADKIMREAGYQMEKNWITRRFEGHDHKEQYWAKRVEIPLKFLLSGQ